LRRAAKEKAAQDAERARRLKQDQESGFELNEEKEG